MAISRLLIENFRNLTAVDLEFDHGFNFLVGNNGSGKTSLLEAIFISGMVAPSKVRSVIALFLTNNRILFYTPKFKNKPINGLLVYRNYGKEIQL